jgi:branched-chain amino acid transport system ATP-binding protein
VKATTRAPASTLGRGFELIVEIEDLYAGYDGVPVVRDATLAVGEGEVIGLLGPNGAGKTTTLLTISGLLKPIKGSVSVFGKPPPFRFPHRLARNGLAMVTESRNLVFDLTVTENLRLSVRGSRSQRRAAIAEAFEMFPALEPLGGRKTGLLSGGEQQMLALARALVSRPKVLLLDEMSLGLAPIIVGRLMEHVRQVSDRTGCAIILVEQHVHLALDVVDRAYVLAHGEIVLTGSAETLKDNARVLESSYLGEAVLEEEESPVGSAQATGSEAVDEQD